MNLNDYFETLSATDIRIQGTRIGIETILLDYLDLGLSPEELSLRYPLLSIEQVYATITYYWHNQDEVDVYLSAWKEHGRQMRSRQAEDLPAAIQRLRSAIALRSTEAHDTADVVVL